MFAATALQENEKKGRNIKKRKNNNIYLYSSQKPVAKFSSNLAEK